MVNFLHEGPRSPSGQYICSLNGSQGSVRPGNGKFAVTSGLQHLELSSTKGSFCLTLFRGLSPASTLLPLLTTQIPKLITISYSCEFCIALLNQGCHLPHTSCHIGADLFESTHACRDNGRLPSMWGITERKTRSILGCIPFVSRREQRQLFGVG